MREPTWGDPSFRRLPINIRQQDVGVSHLHLNPRDILLDFNILLPIRRFQELVSEGQHRRVGAERLFFHGLPGLPRRYPGLAGEVRPAGRRRAEGGRGELHLTRPGLTGLRPQRARAGTYARSRRSLDDPGQQHALLGGAGRCAAHTGGRISIWSHTGTARRCRSAEAGDRPGAGGAGNAATPGRSSIRRSAGRSIPPQPPKTGSLKRPPRSSSTWRRACDIETETAPKHSE